MGNTPSFTDAFGRPGSPAAGPHALAPDRFKPKADQDAVKRAGKPGDAFAGKGPAKGATAASFYNPFDTRPRAAAMQPAPEARPEKARPERAKPVKAKADKPQRMLANGAALQVVASQPDILPFEKVERSEVKRMKPAAKPSSLVLVSNTNVVTDSAEPAAMTGGPGELSMPRIDPPSQAAAPRTGGGGGGSGGGRGIDARPLRDRVFNQDDLVGVLIVIAMLLLLALYFFRGGGGQSAPIDNRIVSTQFAAVEPAAPPKPLADPFGDQPVDLTPKSPAPPEAAIAPAPAAPAVAARDITMHAWFCTAQSELTPQTMAALDKQLVSWKADLATHELVVTGFADTRGASDYNLSLGSARATAIADYLKSKGVKVAAASGVGELDGLTDNQNCSNQRRVDVRLSGGADEPPSRSCAPPKEVEELACA
jgi:outer membrane protein OmpA-like peptidoglycan-associated protein